MYRENVKFTYLSFHLIFTLPLVLILGYYYIKNCKKVLRIKEPAILMVILSVIYTSPWDQHLINRGIWFYGDKVVSSWILGIPLGEYIFFVLQTIGTSLFLYLISFEPVKNTGAKIFGNISYALPSALITILGLWMVISGSLSSFYLGSILAWAGPIITLQWAYGGRKLWEQKKTLLIGIVIPSFYLWVIDAIAISKELWILPLETRTGIEVFSLPIEEAVFFLVTNMMVVQGIILYSWTINSFSSIGDLKRGIKN